MKKLIALLLAECLMLGLMTTAFAADEKSNDIVILYTNDVHCAVDDNIGYAGLAAYKKEMQAAYNYVALVDCGDSVQGDVIGTLSKGEYLVDIMNEVGYDFASFGNHEFDYTLPQLQKLIDKAKYQYLCCNLTYTAKDGKGLTGYKAYEIKTYGDIEGRVRRHRHARILHQVHSRPTSRMPTAISFIPSPRAIRVLTFITRFKRLSTLPRRTARPTLSPLHIWALTNPPSRGARPT